ncbi:MAG: exopolysaccharide biosynthesis polyprenyl glycosylphosphotransferase [Acidimicrobiia bacterium]
MILGGWAVASRLVHHAVLFVLRRTGALRYRAVLVGGGEAVGHLVGALSERRHGIEVVAIATGAPRDAALDAPWYPLPHLRDVLTAARPDCVIATSTAGLREIDAAAAAVQGPPPEVWASIPFEPYTLDLPARAVRQINAVPLTRLRAPAPVATAWRRKRTFDIAVTGLALALLFPLLAVIALAVRLSSPGPILFRQERIGQGGRTFDVLKFRSMRVNDDSEVTWSVRNDARVTRVGHILRRSGMDELPQLLNILKGDMSIVGPRPERPFFHQQFAQIVPRYEERLRAPAGLTGLAQVEGLRGGGSSIVDRVRHDNYYIDHWRFTEDLRVMVRTVWSLAQGEQEKPVGAQSFIVLSDEPVGGEAERAHATESTAASG